ncbi:MAG: hypothetical protein ACRDBM_02440 [Sporomusa sp.]
MRQFVGDVDHDTLNFLKLVLVCFTWLAQAYSRAFSYVNSAANDLEKFEINRFTAGFNVLKGLVSNRQHGHTTRLLVFLLHIRYLLQVILSLVAIIST